jgi:hypothetical protein
MYQMSDEYVAQLRKREIDVTLLGNACIDPFYGTTSAARGAMYLSHIGQSPEVEGAEPRRFQAGMESQFGEYNFDIRFPVDCVILNVVRKYPTSGFGGTTIRHNPVTTIVYEHYYDKHKTIDILHITDYMSFHQDFGFKLEKRMDIMHQLEPGQLIGKDTIIAASRTVKDNGMWGNGVNMNAAFMSTPGTIEDGFEFGDEALEKLSPRTYNEVVGNAGRKAYFLNMYGDATRYQPFPDIGQKIRPDGVIFALRDLDPDLAPGEMTTKALMTLDRTFDRAVIGTPGAVVVDINIFHDDRVNPSFTPTGMDEQMVKYHSALTNYYREIMTIYQQLYSRRKDKLRIGEPFNQLVVEAQIHLPVSRDKRKLTRMYRLDTLDEWRVAITYESIKMPGNAYKATDMHGGKGVICSIKKTADMPIDQWGNRVDVVIFGGSTMRRSNYGRLYEQGFGAAARDLIQRLRLEKGLDAHATPSEQQLREVLKDREWVDYAFGELTGLYAIIAPAMNRILLKDPDPAGHVYHCLRDQFYLYVPVDEQISLMEATNTLMASKYRPNFGPVTYRDDAGKMVTTVNNVLTGPLYIMLLEKIGEDWSAVASVKTQPFGLPSKLNNSDRASTPGRETAIRSFGESETRSYNSVVGAEATNELIDQTNNPLSHACVVSSILEAEYSTNIERAVDRNVVPLGGSRPAALFLHLLKTRGMTIVNKPCTMAA